MITLFTIVNFVKTSWRARIRSQRRLGQIKGGHLKFSGWKILVVPVMLLAACAPPPPKNGLDQDSNLKLVYAAAEASLRDLGKMRTEVAPADAPFTYDDLTHNFMKIALHNEYGVSNGKFIARQSQTHLRRWEGPVRVGLISGPSTPVADARENATEVDIFTRRIAGVTGLDMSRTNPEAANMLILFLNEQEQIDFADTLPTRYPGISPAVVDAFRNSPRNIFCAAFAFTKAGRKGVYENALILIKSEHSNFMRKSCIHEEMAQAMGLTNDSPDARPSIFNDDEEFAFLTRHDEILLRMLYDPRLKAGMESHTVRPLLPAIARDAAR